MEMIYTTILKNIRHGKHFSFSRYGDGEFTAILRALGKKTSRHNTDKHLYYPDMGERLYNILRSEPKYWVGLQPLAMRIMENDVKDILDGLSLKTCSGDLLHSASIRGELQAFFDVLQGRPVVIIGNRYLRGFHKLKSLLVEIPEVNCWLSYQHIKNELVRVVRKGDILLYCASMMSEVLIDDMYNLMGDKITQIDCGSLFDPYVHRKTRSYHHKLVI